MIKGFYEKFCKGVRKPTRNPPTYARVPCTRDSRVVNDMKKILEIDDIYIGPTYLAKNFDNCPDIWK